MASNPENNTENIQKNLRIFAENDDNEIVISGMSGRFPNSKSIAEYEYNLYNKIDMVDEAETRWKNLYAEIPKRSGKLYELEKFDASFFDINFKEAHSMDPQFRLLLEVTYETIIDAGVNPNTLRNSNTGVYVGSSISESENYWYYDKITDGGFGLKGCSRAMLSNRLSSILGLGGPSCLIDTACSGSMYALDNAFSALRSGQIDAALVCGTNLLLHPYISLQFARLGVLAKDGCCRSFDNKATGYTRSEAINCLFLQRKKQAKRIYATVVYSKTNCDGYKEEGITYPSGIMQKKLLNEFYKDCKVSPSQLGYLEAHSTGTVVGDPEECKAIENALCKKRNEPLLVGSVKSNIGHAEAASAICSIVKAIFSFQNGKIPPNINFDTEKELIPALMDGRLKVVSEVKELNEPYIGVSSFGFGGANGHVLLKACDKNKINHSIPVDDLARLVVCAGRTEEAITAVFDAVEGKPLDAEFISLLNNIHIKPIRGFMYRGYGVFSKDKNGIAKCFVKDSQYFPVVKRPIVWIFSGIGTQWYEMGSSLMNIPIFKESIQKCHNILKLKKIDLINILTGCNSKEFNNPLNSLLGITSIQIALVDILYKLKIEPQYIIGHSVGELCCAYADGALTAEQTLLVAFHTGIITLETENLKGAMATVYMESNKLKKILPESIEIVWRNSNESCAISGPARAIAEFVSILNKQNIIVIAIPCSNIAYHSRYLLHLGDKFSKSLREIITQPKKRSQKWLSTSVSKIYWETKENQYCSAEYFIKNFLNKVLFTETASMLPRNALTIEIAPRSFSQSILQKCMPYGHHIALAEGNNENNPHFFFQAIGRMFLAGLEMPIEKLYPKIQYPVSKSTPSICSLIKWDHNENWFVPKIENIKKKQSGQRRFKIDLQVEDDEYLSGHVIDGRNLVPATAYLQFVWETFSLMSKSAEYVNVSVEFENIKFLRATYLTKENPVFLTIMIHYNTGIFEITESGALVVTGIIREIINSDSLPRNFLQEQYKLPFLQNKDFYKELRLRGYQYNGGFRAVQEASADGLCGKVKWDSNWVTFMDCLLQIHILGTDSRTFCLPTRIRKMRIFAKHHLNLLNNMYLDNPTFQVQRNPKHESLKAGGIEIIGLQTSPMQRKKPIGLLVLEKYEFVSNYPSPTLSISDAVRCCVQLALENTQILKMKIVEVGTDNSTSILPFFLESIDDLPVVSGEYFLYTNHEKNLPGITIEVGEFSAQKKCAFVIGKNFLENQAFIDEAGKCLSEIGYLVSRENIFNEESVQSLLGFQTIATFSCDAENLVLLQKIKTSFTGTPSAIEVSINDKKYSWLSAVQNAMTSGPVVLYSFNEKYNGLLGMVNCLRKEPNGNLVSCVLIDDPTAPKFDMEIPFYKNQLKLGLAVNIYKNGKWGTYRHLKILPNTTKQSTTQHIYGNLMHRGDLSTLNWFEGPFDLKNSTITIVYSSLNFRDVMLATGKLAVELYGEGRLDQMCVLGFEFCGIENYTNRRVMGMIEKSGCSTFLTAAPVFLWELPNKWSLAEAATIPCVYTTVYYAFFFCTQIEAGKSILIHAGTGGVGLAAIRTALAYGLDVYTTVSSTQKKKFLLNTFPQLKESRIGQSRDTSFELMIRYETQAKGVDYILNSLAEDKLLASIRCLAKGGHFLEIGKFDIANDSKLGLGNFITELSFHSVYLDNLYAAEHSLLVKSLKTMIQHDINQGIIQPLPSHIFNAEQIEEAFRFLASAKHMGKVLIKVREEGSDLSLPIRIIPQKYFDPELVYVIPGGLGGFGLEFADWLVIRGAKKLILSSSRGITKSYQSYRISLWESYGCSVLVNIDNITTKDGCEKLIKHAKSLGEIGGIFNLAVLLCDAIFTNQTPKLFTECLAPKAIATKYLDELSRKLCPKLQYFVIFSSVSCGRGNAGQTNYGMANSIMEKIIEDRVSNGYPGKAIQWGAVGEVGLVADMAEDKIDIEIGGTFQQRISSCLQELDNFLTVPNAIVASMVVAEKRTCRTRNETNIETIMNILGIRDLKSISMGSNLSEIGMDSLMAVEIRQALQRDFELFLTPQDLRSLTFQELQGYLDGKENNMALPLKPTVGLDYKLKGIESLFQNLGDEVHAHKTLLKLPTKAEVNYNSNPVIIVPGVEGVASNLWYNITANLKSKAYILQLTKTRDSLDVNDIANIYIHKIKVLLKKSDPFYLIGYSFGALITLRFAKLLETDGYKGQVLIIDGSPMFLKKMAVAHLDNDFKNLDIFLTDVLAPLFPIEQKKILSMQITKRKSIEEKIEYFAEYLEKENLYTKQYAYNITLGILNRIKLLHKLNVNEIEKINSSITLVRPSEVSIIDIDEDYGLSKLTKGNITLKYITGNHTTMLDNSKLLEIINEYSPL